MIKQKLPLLLLLLAALPFFQGCASFNSGDIRVDRDVAEAMLEDKELVPFSELEVSWRNFPYRSATDTIGQGSASRPAPALKPVQVAADDEAGFRDRARKIFHQAGLYDKKRGQGTLRLELLSFGRWSYSDLFRSFLVDTSFIFLIPASLQVNYYLAADFAVSSGTIKVGTEGSSKTTFHLLLAPFYPFISPGAKESGLLKQMLWRSATDIYTKLKAAGTPPAPLPPKPPEPEEKTQPLSGPPVEPDRTWLPGQDADDGEPDALPEKPNQTWQVPQEPGTTSQPEPDGD